MAKVHQGKFANDKATFEVSQVLYGDLTGSGQEQAVVVASCTPQVARIRVLRTALSMSLESRMANVPCWPPLPWAAVEFHGKGDRAKATRPTCAF
jgi:hypothetical protein